MADPKVEVHLKASRTCYLSNDPPFRIVLMIDYHNIDDSINFLQDGYSNDPSYQPINSNKTIQCFDGKTGKQIQLIHQGSEKVLLDRNYVQWTTSTSRKEYELNLNISSLQPNKNYKLCFAATKNITHWPNERNIPWTPQTPDPIIFTVKRARPETPQISASLSVPAIYSLSQPLFEINLRFSSTSPFPITILANRSHVLSSDKDIEILDAETRECMGPDEVDDGDDDGDIQAEQFLSIDGEYTEQRRIDFHNPMWENTCLEIGKEYIIRYKGEKWWWSEDSIGDVMAFLGSGRGIGLERSKKIEVKGGGEGRFKVVE